MVDEEGGSCLVKQVYPALKVWSGTEKKKKKKKSPFLSFPVTSSVVLVSVWLAVGSCPDSIWFPFDLSISLPMHID